MMVELSVKTDPGMQTSTLCLRWVFLESSGTTLSCGLEGVMIFNDLSPKGVQKELLGLVEDEFPLKAKKLKCAVWCQNIFPKYRDQFLACGLPFGPIFIRQVEQTH